MSLEARDLVAGYGRGPVLRGIDLELRSGQLAAVVGPNGAGKSTLVRCLAGLLRPDSGQVLIEGRDVRGLSRSQVARVVAVVPQQTETLFPFSVREIVALGRVARLGLFARASVADSAAVDGAIRDLDLAPLAGRRIDTLSGGERQRALLAMALAQGPRVLLLDEPTVHLDPAHQRAALDRVRALARDRGIAALAVLHDLNLAATLCDRVVVVAGGRIVADGPPLGVIVPDLVANVFGRCLVVGDHAGVPYVLPSRLT